MVENTINFQRHSGSIFPTVVARSPSTHRSPYALGAGIWLIVILAALLLPAAAGQAQWSALPGERVRNAFGPAQGQVVRACRGACGLDCPSSCVRDVTYECNDSGGLRRVSSYTCGTHQGCREHDDCLDRCSQQQAQGYDCANQCNALAIGDYGLELAGPWALGGGSFDGDIVFEYTRDTPDAQEAIYRCPDDAQLMCTDAAAKCMMDSVSVSPVFDSYPATDPRAVRIAGFRSGRVCHGREGPDGVCETLVDIRINGDDTCPTTDGSAPCTWYGFEFDYENADPAQPLVCTASTDSGDFVGGVVSDVLRAVPARQGTQLGDLLGHFKKELSGGASLGDMLSGITITRHGAGGEVVGAAPNRAPPPRPGVPRTIALASGQGHVLVPMFELRDAPDRRPVLTRDVRCTHRGQPVLETSFRLHFVCG